jgi:transcriptional regulator with XRE-family HTH domain
MTEDRWRTWDEIEAEAKKAGRLDEARVAAHRERMRAEQRAYRLAEIRKQQGLTQTDVAAAMHVSQRRVSAVERGDLSRTELGTVASYVEAIGGKVEIVADFGDERVVIGLRAAATKHRQVGCSRMAWQISPDGIAGAILASIAADVSSGQISRGRRSFPVTGSVPT